MLQFGQQYLKLHEHIPLIIGAPNYSRNLSNKGQAITQFRSLLNLRISIQPMTYTSKNLKEYI